MDFEAQESPAESAQREGREQVFPRRLTSDLLAQAQRAEARRVRAQVLVLAAAILALALGMPNELPWGAGWLTRSIAGERPADLLGALGRGLSALSGLGPDSTAYLLSALFLSANFILFYRLLVGFGFPPLAGLVGTATACLAPLSWLAGTSGLAFGAGALAACALALALLRGSREGRAAAIFPLYTLAWLIYPENGLLLPACWLALEGCPAWVKRRARLGLLASGALCLLRVAWLPPASLPAPQLSVSGFLGCLGLGTALLGFGSLLFARRPEEESAPPPWVLAWLLCGALGCALTPIGAGPAGACLLPIGALGVADWVARQEREGLALRVGAAFLLPQVLLCGLAQPLFRATLARDLPFVARAHERLELGDFVLAAGERASFLLRHRFGLEVWTLEPEPSDAWPGWSRAREARAAGRRLVLVAQLGHEPGPETRTRLAACGAIELEQLPATSRQGPAH